MIQMIILIASSPLVIFAMLTWVFEDEEAVRSLRRLRILVATWNFAAVPLFILSALWNK